MGASSKVVPKVSFTKHFKRENRGKWEPEKDVLTGHCDAWQLAEAPGHLFATAPN